jgi:hypothetical protein
MQPPHASSKAGWQQTARVAAVLLICQVFAAFAPLADAQEPENAPPVFEAHHDASCLVLHDELRCTLCSYAHWLVVPEPVPAPEWLARVVVCERSPRATALVSRPEHQRPLPRAPPVAA